MRTALKKLFKEHREECYRCLSIGTLQLRFFSNKYAFRELQDENHRLEKKIDYINNSYEKLDDELNNIANALTSHTNMCEKLQAIYGQLQDGNCMLEKKMDIINASNEKFEEKVKDAFKSSLEIQNSLEEEVSQIVQEHKSSSVAIDSIRDNQERLVDGLLKLNNNALDLCIAFKEQHDMGSVE